MKKVFTLVFLSIITMAGFSQSDNGKIEKSKDVILGGDRKTKSGNGKDNGTDVILGRRDNGGVYSGSDRDTRVRDINREYDRKIYEVRNNRNLTSAEKERVIRRLEKERADRLRQVNGDYRNRDDRYGKDKDKDYKYKKEKSNNGKHKGWEKGKGHQKNNHNGKHDHDD